MATPTPAPAGGIYNPAVNPAFGTGQGEVIFAKIVATILKFASIGATLVFLAMLILGGLQWISAAGDKEDLSAAQKKITNAIIGVVVFLSLFALINFVAPMLGLDFLSPLNITWPTP